jgi:hypothetical protein
MTKGSNLPYRRLAVELGARVLVSEMTVARRLKQKRKSEFALIRRAPDEPCFGVQLAGTNPEEMAWAAALGRIARRRFRGREPRVSDRSLHAQGHGRCARTPALARPAHRRGRWRRASRACR